MKLFLSVITFATLIVSSPLFAAGCPFSKGCGHDKHLKKNNPKPEKSRKAAVAVYRCGCSQKLWKQNHSDKKACPYCGPAMPDCGELIKLLPKRGEEYDIKDYKLPNETCPVMGRKINKSIYIEHKGEKIYFCCAGCIDTFTRNPERYMRKISLKGAAPATGKDEDCGDCTSHRKNRKKPCDKGCNKGHEAHENHDHEH